MMDNYYEYEKVVRKNGETELKMMERKETLTNIIMKIFSEIGREKTMQLIRQDLREGRRASVRVVDEKTVFAPTQEYQDSSDSEV